MTEILVAASAAVLAVLATGLIRLYAVHRQILDLPNDRSSHQIATPRGGGMSVVVVWFAGMLVAGYPLTGEALLDAQLLAACALVALVGFFDDHRPLAARWRISIHVAAAVWVILALGGMPPVPFGTVLAEAGWIGGAVGVVYLTWMLNLYNFMDGIDGIAGLEAVTVAGSAALLSLVVGIESLSPVIMLLGSATLGFVVWNFPRARIFMGDGGSGFLGFTFGVLSLVSALQAPALFWSWVILLGVFIVDATTTLFARTRRGARLSEAHRSHAYQYAARRLGRHWPVSTAVAAINLCWLLPLALVAAKGWLDGWFVTVIAYLPLVLLARGLHAGAPEMQEA